jgi:hypothetical protein
MDFSSGDYFTRSGLMNPGNVSTPGSLMSYLPWVILGFLGLVGLGFLFKKRTG